MKKTRLTQFIDNARSFSIGEAIEIFLGENTMATTAKNYTDEMVASMTIDVQIFFFQLLK